MMIHIRKDFSGDLDVIDFINDFLNHHSHITDVEETLIDQFLSGYCYYFAHILKAAFNRGSVCWAAPHGHVVWLDNDNTPYDITGEFTETDAFYGYISEEKLGHLINVFKHLPNDDIDVSNHVSELAAIVYNNLDTKLSISEIESNIKKNT